MLSLIANYTNQQIHHVEIMHITGLSTHQQGAATKV